LLPINNNPFSFKPSFEINFWLKHFCGYTNDECRAYEAFVDQPIVETMYFADTIDDYSDDLTIDYVDYLGPFIKIKEDEEDEFTYAGDEDVDYEEKSTFKFDLNEEEEDIEEEDFKNYKLLK